MFEVVFDYGDHDAAVPNPNDDQAKDATGAQKYPWKPRPDPFSTYRSGFEVRTTRLCQRVLMFHHFPGESGVERDCLVRSTDFIYSDDVDPTDVHNPVYTFLQAAIQTVLVQTFGINATKRSGTLRGSCGENSIPDFWRPLVFDAKLSKFELTFPDPMHEFNAGDGDRGALKALQSEHWTQTKFDRPVILFDQIVIWHV
jgi:Salmonella virulence plasmid 65kDa B protein